PILNSETDLDSIAEGIEIASKIHKNKTKELSSLVQGLSQTIPLNQTLSQQSSPLEILESHLQGELPKTSETRPVHDDPTIPTVENLYIPTSKAYERMLASLDNVVNPEVEISSEAIKITSELQASEKQPTSEQQILITTSEPTTSEHQPTPEHLTSEPTLSLLNTYLLNQHTLNQQSLNQ
ncbi:hypothetical protein A2U01_0030858, partial [Trifolium medium]|nr:hypothetical protein [Trifolium medium]